MHKLLGRREGLLQLCCLGRDLNARWTLLHISHIDAYCLREALDELGMMRRCSRAIKVVRSGAREILRCGVCRRRSQDGQSVTKDPEDRTKPKADMTHEPRAATFGGHRCHCTAAIARVFCSLCQTLHVCMGSNRTCI